MDSYVLDDDNETINWNDISKVKHLDPTSTYRKLLEEINECLDPRCNLMLNFDYESIQLLLKQACEFEIPFVDSDDLVAVFITKCGEKELRQKLFLELGYGEGRKAAKVIDPHIFKRICHTLEEEMDISDIQKYRKLLLGGLLEDDLFSLQLRIEPEKYILDTNYYFDHDSKRRTESESIQLFYLDLISEYFFGDYYENIVLDIKQMLKYIDLTFNRDIPKDRLSFYQDFIHLSELTYQEQSQFFESHRELSIMEDFYDDMRHLKDQSYQSLVDSCTKFNKNSSLYNKELSEMYGCDIYYLDGQDFFGFVRSDVEIKKKRVSDSLQLEDTPVPTGDEIKRLGHSFTYIGKEDIQTFQHPNEVLTMLYTGIDYRAIGHVYHNDSWSSSSYYYYSDYQNELHTPESLLHESTKYPEILITELEGIEPCALLVLDEVTPWDIEFSKKNNLPIVVINTKKYERKFSPENYTADHYTR